jgi:redox-sensing transcriptional repressor
MKEKTAVPKPALQRLCRMYTVLEELELQGQAEISSAGLSALLGIPAHTIRKDISYLPGGPVSSDPLGQKDNSDTSLRSSQGYHLSMLLKKIDGALGISSPLKTCIVGLGRIGMALLSYQEFVPRGIHIVAGFDKNINKIELTSSPVPLFPSYEIEERIQALRIDLGVIAVPASSAQQVADRLIRGGIKGLLNFAPVTLKSEKPVVVRNIYMVEEFRFLSALIRLQK